MQIQWWVVTRIKHRHAEFRSITKLFQILWEFRSGYSSGFRDKSWSQNLLPYLNIGFGMVLVELSCVVKLRQNMN